MKSPAIMLLAAALTVLAAPSPARAADKGAASAEGAATLDPARQRTLYLGIIESLRKGGHASAALAHLDSFDRQYPRDTRAQVLRADCLSDIGEAAAAEALYRKAVGGPFADQAQAGLGRIFAGRGDWAAAATAFAEAVKRKPTEVAYLNDLGFALIKGGKAEEGRFRLRQALELAPNDVLARNNLIVALETAGRTAEAEALADAAQTPVERTAARAVLAEAAAPSAVEGEVR